jgi:hypothetical protein
MVDRPIEQLLAEQEARDRQKQIDREMEDAQLAADKQRLLIEAQQSASSDSNDSEEEDDEPTQQERTAQRSILRFVREVQYARSLEARPVPDYGDVTVDQRGMIVEQRRPVYPVVKLVEQDIEQELVKDYVDVFSEIHRVVDESLGL